MTGGPTPPVLVAAAHGTRLAAGRRVLALLRLQVGAARPGLRVVTANIDEKVQRPGLAPVLARVCGAPAGGPGGGAGGGAESWAESWAEGSPGGKAVVVPLLLSMGYHASHDVKAALKTVRGAAVAAGPLGPDPVLAALLARRLDEAGAAPDDAVVVAAAGSSDPRGARDVAVLTGQLQALREGPVTAGYLSAATPRVEDAVASARAEGARRVALATYLLAPGVFQRRLAGLGADVVTAPLAPDATLAALVLRRYDDALELSLRHVS